MNAHPYRRVTRRSASKTVTKSATRMSKKIAGSGITLGSVLAVVISWILNRSIIWAIVHFFFGWLYVFYACCVYTDEIDAAGRQLTGDDETQQLEKADPP